MDTEQEKILIEINEDQYSLDTFQNMIDMVLMPEQIEFICRAKEGDVQARFPRQAGSTTTLAIAVTILLAEGNIMQWVALPEMHEVIVFCLQQLFDRLELEYVVLECEYDEQNGYAMNHRIKTATGYIRFGSSWNTMMSLDYIVTDSNFYAAYFPYTLDKVVHEKVKMLEICSGKGVQWDQNPIIMKWEDCAIYDQNFILHQQKLLPPKLWQNEFEPGFDYVISKIQVSE